MNLKIKNKWVLFLVSIFLYTNTFSQSYLDDDAKLIMEKCGLQYDTPNNYFRITPPDSYFSIHPDFDQSMFYIGLINKDTKIMITISTVPYPKGITKAEQYLIANVDLNHISDKAIAAQIDTTFSKIIDLDEPHLKNINADRGIIYNIKVQGKYLGIYPRCKKVEVYRDNVARAEILFFYKDEQENQVKQEIEKTWGMLKFKS